MDHHGGLPDAQAVAEAHEDRVEERDDGEPDEVDEHVQHEQVAPLAAADVVEREEVVADDEPREHEEGGGCDHSSSRNTSGGRCCSGG